MSIGYISLSGKYRTQKAAATRPGLILMLPGQRLVSYGRSWRNKKLLAAGRIIYRQLFLYLCSRLGRLFSFRFCILSMDGKTAVNAKDTTIVKVYGEPETPSTQHRRLSPASHARRAGTECKARSIVYARSIAHDESREH